MILGEVTDIDLDRPTVTSQVLGRDTVTSYDSLLVAAGASQSYFGNDHFAEFAPGMKSIDDALELRGRIFGAFEMAELGANARRRRRPPADLRGRRRRPDRRGDGRPDRRARPPHAQQDFRAINTRTARVSSSTRRRQVLPPFGSKLGEKAKGELEKLGVEVMLGAHGHRRRRARPRGEVQGRPRRADQLRHQDLGRRRAGQPARQDAVRADRRPARPRRPHRGQPRPHAARPPRGLRRRRHDRSRQPARCRAGRDPGSEVRRQGDPQPPRGQGPAGAVQVLRQGLDGHHQPLQRRRDGRQAPPHRRRSPG